MRTACSELAVAGAGRIGGRGGGRRDGVDGGLGVADLAALRDLERGRVLEALAHNVSHGQRQSSGRRRPVVPHDC